MQLVFDANSGSTNNPPVPVTGTAAFDFSDVVGGVKVSVTVANTTSNPGITQSYLTAFGFDFVENTTFRNGSFVAGAYLDTSSVDVTTGVGLPGNIEVDFCAYATASCQAGGGVNTGIPGPQGADHDDMFMFILDTMLTAGQVNSAYFEMFNQTYAKTDAVVAMRWRGLTGPAATSTSETKYNPSVVPLPASLPLLVAALGGLGAFGWRRRAT